MLLFGVDLCKMFVDYIVVLDASHPRQRGAPRYLTKEHKFESNRHPIC